MLNFTRCSMFVAVAALGLATGANAEIRNYTVTLDESQVVGGTGSPATGTGTVTYDTATGELDWNISYADLLGSLSLAHFHGPAPAGVNAGVQVTIPVGASPLIGNAPITPSQADDLDAGLWYVNLHTSFAGGGEIRGQVVPEPVSAALLIGPAALMLVRRRAR